jgi:DNA repair exonuclease SbcCD ATPase subunit
MRDGMQVLSKYSLNTQKMVSIFLVSILVFLSILLTYQLAWQLWQRSNSLEQFNFPQIILIALLFAGGIGLVNYALQSLIYAQIFRGIEWLKCEFTKSQEDENITSINSAQRMPKEFEKLANMWIDIKFSFLEERSQLMKKIEELGQEEEYLREEIEKLQTAFEKVVYADNFSNPNQITIERDSIEGEVGDFIAKLQRDFESNHHSVVCLTSSSTEEITRYKEQLEYRISWLRVLLEDAEKELKFLYILYS